MQWDKKQGAGSKGTWGKVGDELKKNVDWSDSEGDEAEAAHEKFLEEVKSKLVYEKLIADELDPVIDKHMPKKNALAVKNPELEANTLMAEKVYVECRSVIETAYSSSIVV